MIEHFAGWDESTLDLVVERCTVGLAQHDEAALSKLADPSDLEDFEAAIAAIHLAGLQRIEAPPREFMAQLEQSGRRHVAASQPLPSTLNRKSSRTLRPVLAWSGWLVAAALMAMFVLFEERGSSGATPNRDSLVASATDLVRIEWTATEDPAAVGASGDVVWSSLAQEGYMRFRGLAANDPSASQYQLWIFDPSRPDWEAKPVDGGVFDITSSGELIVPIDAKLAIQETALFAVTVEVPGGVVVSDRERIVLTAAL